MKKAPIPDNEKERLDALKRFNVLDTADEAEFDEITKLAATICETKISLVSLIDTNRQWFKSKFGLKAQETPRDVSYCGHAIMGCEVFEVSDSKLDPSFCDNPLYTGEPHVCFYAGAPLITEDGFRIGTLCVIDPKPKKLNENQIKALKSLAKQVVYLLELKVKKQHLGNVIDQLKKAQELSNIGSWEFNLVTHEQTWSSENYKIFEIKEPQRKDVLHQLYRERILPEDLKTLDFYIQRAMTTGEGFEIKHKVIFDNGKRIKYVHGVGKATFDKNGKPILLSGTCRDCTREVENESNYQTLLQTMSEGLVVQNSKGEIVQFNEAAMQILELSKDELLGKNSKDPRWRAVKSDGSPFPGEQHPAMVALQTGKSQVAVRMGLKFDLQKIKWIQINSLPFERNNEKFVLSTFSDITLMVQASEENQFVLNTLGIGIWKFNPVSQKLVWDKLMYNLYEVNEDEFNGHYNAWEATLSPEAKTKATEDLRLALSGEKVFDTTFEIKIRSGKNKYIGGKGKVIRNENNEAIMMYGINWDKSKEVLLLQELEVQRAKAIHSSKLASLGEVSGGIAHEINNPLTIILGSAEHLLTLFKSKSKIPNDKLEKQLKVILKNTQRAASIVKSLKSLSRNSNLDSFKPESLKVVIEEVTELFSEKLRHQSTVFKVDIKVQSDVMMIHSQLGQILMNVLNNAFDAVSSLKTEQWIRLEAVELDSKIKISVSDSGRGINVENRAKLMQPFFTTKPVGKGTGLGLSISRQIAENHGGTLYLEESKPYTCFVLELPLALKSVKSA
ncbi:MAG: PAS domain-containing protein [Xanthomonadaceae bacterium]|nr:PAS domain-containing protein [Xanthomonadaceae bacterium]